MNTKIKVCGITGYDDASLALNLGAWALGFIFFADSPRSAKKEVIRDTLAQLRTEYADFRTVGVFVNERLAQVEAYVRELGLDTVQLHGDESPEDCAQLKKRLPAIKVVKAVRPFSAGELPELRVFEHCDALLLDTYIPSLRGGTGILNDFKIFREACAQKIHRRIIFAGGLSPNNVERVIQHVNAYALDVSSGLEDQPGKKSDEKMREFFEHVRNFDRMRAVQ